MKLSIAEGFYLIALDDEEGRILAAAEKTVVPGVIAACILELYLLKKLSWKVVISPLLIPLVPETGYLTMC